MGVSPPVTDSATVEVQAKRATRKETLVAIAYAALYGIFCLRGCNYIPALGRVRAYFTDIPAGTDRSPVKVNVSRLSGDIKRVYSAVVQAGHDGITVKEIRTATSLSQVIVSKALKGLESFQMVSQVRSVTQGSKKVYILMGLRPSAEITGGPWYQGSTFDEDLVERLVTKAQMCIAKTKMNGASVAKVTSQLQASGETTKALKPEDVARLLDAMVAEGLLERIQTRGQNLYVCVSAMVGDDEVHSVLPELCYSVCVPCMRCPVRNRCRSGNVLCPEKCQYMKAWMDGDVSMTQ
ncbi:RNA polymerase Rpc34 [Kipferlia bialata]|uniref:RNA polymerase Rpc34 n=1 Tax=Kipferlia bialata TaxID=797122 RepID=A0A9K3CUU1_9EUKA|nr:RNA polymerase Rpc34 [Kipferlia bialata]|eukprot:g4047.t1